LFVEGRIPDPYKYKSDPDADLGGPKTYGPTDPDPDPGGPKTYGSYGSGSGTGTLIASMQNILSYVGTEVWSKI
jgi:hypothetical protein